MKIVVISVVCFFMSLGCFSQEDTFEIPKGNIEELSDEKVFECTAYLFGYSILANARRSQGFYPEEYFDGFENRIKDPKYGIVEAELKKASEEIAKAKRENKEPNPNDLKLMSKFNGIKLAIELANNRIKLDPALLRKGYAFALKDKNNSISNETIKAFISETNKRGTKAHITANLKWLDDNKEKEGVITLPNGLQYQVIKEGSGAKLTGENVVKVHYTGSLIDGTIFDSSRDPGRTPFETQVEGNIINGWRQGLQQMQVGGQYKLFIPSNLGYGVDGSPPIIKPHSTLIFEMEVVELVK